ncbi:recombinase family protein [Streptomyces sp. DH12]|uniref:recombinase family protein n=1 Tax=Streptomyces sp. DH12 TaxID=2857010 RepID=UPI001E4F5163|nr:recombinase family protein [Streptomyces sp. DH12]
MELIALGDRDHQDMVRAVTYGRQSHKSETDSQASPKMQRDTGIAYINSQTNWRHVGHYEDVGLSGYDPNVFRPDFERLMEDARKKKFDVVVIYMLSRLTRQGAAEALKIQQELARHGVALVSTQEPFINTSDDNPFGVAFFALIAGLAHQESKNKSKFIRDTFAKLKAKGSHSSGPVPFGFDVDTVNVDGITIRTLRPGKMSSAAGDAVGPESTPADTVDFILRQAEDGTNPSAIADKLVRKQARTPMAHLGEEEGKALRASAAKRRKRTGDDAEYDWSATVVTRILRDPRIAGFAIGAVNQHTKRREILRDEEGQPVQPHTGFRTPAQWYSIQKFLDGRAPAERRDRTGERTFLGSWNVLRCGLCDAGMTVARTAQSYVCNLRRRVGDQERHVLRISQEFADAIVAERVWARLSALDPSDPDDLELLAAAAERFAVQGASPEAAEELAEQEAQLEHVQESIKALTEDRDAYVGPTARAAFRTTMAKYAAHEARCMERIAELTAQASTSTRLPLDEWLEDDDPFAANGLWARWGVDDRRAFLALFVDHIRVAPAGGKSGSARERAERRIEIEWVKPAIEEAEELTLVTS